MTIAIIVPCYNESERWNSKYWMELISLPGINWVFVNDGSTDKTKQLLGALDMQNVEIISKMRNSGKSQTLRIGMQHAIQNGLYEAIGFIDADGGISPLAFERFIESYSRLERNNLDAFWGSRINLSGRHIRRKKTRHLIGRTIARFLSFGLDLPYDTQCGLKIFRNSIHLENALNNNFQSKWFFELELYQNYNMNCPIKMRIWEEPLSDWFDVPGSKISISQFATVFSEILTVKKNLRKASYQSHMKASEREK